MKKRKIFIIITSILFFLFAFTGIVVVILFKNRITKEDYIKVADYVFEKYDNGEYILTDYDDWEFLESIDDDEIYKIVSKHKRKFRYMSVSCCDQVTFEDSKIHFLGHSGVAVTRNNITPVYRGSMKPRKATYRKVGERIYRYRTFGH